MALEIVCLSLPSAFEIGILKSVFLWWTKLSDFENGWRRHNYGRTMTTIAWIVVLQLRDQIIKKRQMRCTHPIGMLSFQFNCKKKQFCHPLCKLSSLYIKFIVFIYITGCRCAKDQNTQANRDIIIRGITFSWKQQQKRTRTLHQNKHIYF